MTTSIVALRDLAAKMVARELEKSSTRDHYIELLRDVPTEYLKLVFRKTSYLTLECFKASGFYDDSIDSSILRGTLQETENYYRNLFAQQRDHNELKDPYLMLINVYDNFDWFKYSEGDAAEKLIPRIFPLTQRKTSGPCVVGREEFLKNFKIFTESQLESLDWSNVIVAGGCVLAALSPVGEELSKSNRALRDYYHNLKQFNNLPEPSPFVSSDIDIFIYGLTADEATEKVKQIFKCVRDCNPANIVCLRTPQCITITSQHPYRNIQIILRLYKSPSEILMGFDLDCVTVGFDGNNVWALPRFHRAVTRQYNLVDQSRRSTTYEYRLYKYSKRGFEVAAPGFDRSKVDPTISCNHPSQVTGLAKLLCYEFRSLTNRFPNPVDPSVLQLEDFREKHSDIAGDYSSTWIPWKQGWNAKRTIGLLRQRRNSIHYVDSPKKLQCVYGNDIDAVLSTDPPTDHSMDDSTWLDNVTSTVKSYITPYIQWVNVDPGRQYIGSFRPIDNNNAGDWDYDAYHSSKKTKVSTLPVAQQQPMFFGTPSAAPLPMMGSIYPSLFGSTVSTPSLPIMITDTRPWCKYGASCYRKNPDHHRQFRHPFQFTE